MSLPAYVRPGDLLFVRGSGFVAWAIKKLTKSQFAHVAIVIDSETVIEAWPGGVRKVDSSMYSNSEVKTCNRLTDQERMDIVQYAEEFLGTPYDYIRIVGILVEIVLHIQNKLMGKGHIICSSFAALAYYFKGHIHLRPGKMLRHLTPEDLYESLDLSDYATAA